MNEGGYRCADCGHGRNLKAWAGANAYGPLAASGSELDEHEDVMEWGIHEDSITCSVHPDAEIEHLVDGQWYRWWTCAECKGSGRVHRRAIGTRDGYPCRALGEPTWGFAFGKHEEWRPVAQEVRCG